MATCKDCLHREACMKFNKVRVEVLEKTASRGAEELCDTFADKSRFIELPCKLGDTVWIANLTKRCVFENKVSGIYIAGVGKNANSIRFEHTNRMGEKSYRKYTFAQIGKTVFLTKEEAEAAIAERSKE